MSKHDAVNHPSHYTTGKVEVIEYIEDKLTPEQLEGYLAGNIIKYVSRYRHKGGVEDLKKARWYLNRLISKLGGLAEEDEDGEAEQEGKQMAWRFPEVKFVKTNTSKEQVEHTMSEAREVYESLLKESIERTDEEMADLLHSCETYFRIREREGAYLYKIFGSVELKNFNRGYYGGK